MSLATMTLKPAMKPIQANPKHKPPFPYFGGKSKIAPEVWRRFGDVRNYVDPFCGSLAMIFARPDPWIGVETVNDADGFVANFWRAVQANPHAVARHADNPVNENDLHARHIWLRERAVTLRARLEGDPDYSEAKIAGWWCWGLCCWIGSGWCDDHDGPWGIQMIDGARQLVHLGGSQGVNRKRVHLGNAGKGVNRKLVHLGGGRGVNRQRAGDLVDYFAGMADRLARVRVCSGDWKRVTSPSVTTTHGLTAVFLDPPYCDARRDKNLYAVESTTVAHEVRTWALAHGDDPMMRIALCGYEGEHAMPRSWKVLAWKTSGGYGSQGSQGSQASLNAHRERIWFSPHCLDL